MCRRLLCSVVIFMCIAATALAQDHDIEIPTTPIPPVIDGEYDGAYSLSDVHYFTTIDAPSVAPADCSGNWRALWDADYIYLIVDVNDDALFGDSGTWQDDAAEFYFDGGNSKGPGTPLSEDDRQYTFLYNQNIVTGTNAITDGVEYASIATDTGWRMEAKLPWSSLQDAAPQLGDLIGIDCFVNDDDDGGTTREHQIGTFGTANSWQIPADWGVALLTKGSLSQASGPQPAAGSIDVLLNTVLNWEPGIYAGKHNVYFGETFADVNSAIVPTVSGQDANSYDPGSLAYGKVYYWRVDEVNASPDKTVYKGEIWSFTAEPFSIMIPVDVTNVTASSFAKQNTPALTVDGSGLTGTTHSTIAEAMWLSAAADMTPWLMYEFDQVQKLDQMLIWNSNTTSEGFIGWGVKDVNIETSIDGVAWTGLGEISRISRAPGDATYDTPQVVDLGLAQAKYIRLNILGNWGGLLPQYGVAEVQFYGVPVHARTPDPVSGAVDVRPDSVVTWRAGREADQHTIYVDTDLNAVTEGASPSESSNTNRVALSLFDLQLGQTHYWRVDEVNTVDDPSVWAGPVWNFSTSELLVVDDFESYNNLSPNRPFQHWLDGFGYSADEYFPDYAGNGTGAGIGHDIWGPSSPYFNGSIMETVSTIQGSTKSMPFYYTNSGSVASKTTRTFTVPQDWTVGGVKTLSIAFNGQTGNTGTLYIMINNAKITYQRDNGNISRGAWQAWNIDLATVNTNLQSITKLEIGVEGSGASGMILIDDIRLYPMAGELITPVDPGINGLVAHYAFEDNANDVSGHGNNGTLNGAPAFGTGVVGRALDCDGVDDYVSTGKTASQLGIGGNSPRTISSWVFTNGFANGAIYDVGARADAQDFSLRTLDSIDNRWRVQYWGGDNDFTFDTAGKWVNFVHVHNGTNTKIYVNGMLIVDWEKTINTADTNPFQIGRYGWPDAYFLGLIDEVKVYNRALSAGEALWLAGITNPIDKPF